jgi:hypothetical protein
MASNMGDEADNLPQSELDTLMDDCDDLEALMLALRSTSATNRDLEQLLPINRRAN